MSVEDLLEEFDSENLVQAFVDMGSKKTGFSLDFRFNYTMRDHH